MLEYYLAGGGLRLAQTIIYASIWIATGCVIAAAFRRMLGREKVRRIFGNDTRWGLLAGWLVGMLLPVCSLGVIPVVREMHRAGVHRGTIVAFGLTAPLFNPMSVLYGLTLSDPIAILSFSLCALVIVSVLGLIWNRGLDTSEVVEEELPCPGVKRMVAVFHSATRELVGPTLLFLSIGILGSVILAICLPKGYLTDQVERDNALAPLVVAFIATPIYSTPLLAMSQIGGMFQHGNSIGAAFSLLILGAGTNLGLFAWFGVTYGVRRVILLFILLAVTTVGLAYAIDKPLYPEGVEPAGHSHAFDVYTHPFDPGYEKDMARIATVKANDFWKANEFGGTYVLALMIVFGIVFVFVERMVDLQAWFTSDPGKNSNGLDRDVPGWLLGITVVAGLIAASVAGCYLYYPAPDDLLGDMQNVNADAVLAAKHHDWEAADKWIGFSDDLSRRLEVGVFLRRGSVGEFQVAKARVYREKLDNLKQAVDTRTTEGIEDLAKDVMTSYFQLSKSFRNIDGS